MDLLADLDRRGLLHDSTEREALSDLLAAGPVTGYCGFDPTSDSLHVGSLLSILALRRLQDAGHRPIALVGGATGMIGDPSGRSAERNLLTAEVLEANVAGIRAVLGRFLDVGGAATMVDNHDWTAEIGLIEFLRDVGKHFTINQMVAKESVRSRMEGTDGISYTEFSYMLLQAHDFLWLHDHHDCRLQIGGSDQWGNIVAGVDLIRRVRGHEARVGAYTWPLLTDAEGRKFGKTAEGTSVWLTENRTSPYAFHQFWINQPDEEVERLLHWMTLLPAEEIAAVMAGHRRAPRLREGQRLLAREVTRFVHGDAAVSAAEAAADALFGGDLADAGPEVFELLEREVEVARLAAGDLLQGTDVVDLATSAGLCASKGAARRALAQGGLYVNNSRAADDTTVGVDDLRFGRWVLLRQGKKRHVLVTAEA